MEYELTYDPKRDLIVGKVEGDIDPELVKAMASELADLVASYGCRKLLNDLRSARITSSTFDIYNMPKIIHKQGVPVACRRALLVSEPTEDFEFLETVSVNAGHAVRVFKDLEVALEWLNAEKPPPDKA